MSKSSVNISKLKATSNELSKIYAIVQAQIKKLDESIASCKGVWQGDAANTYLNAYQTHSQNIRSLATAIQSCSSMLQAASTSYGKADAAAAEIIKSNLSAKG